MSAIVSKNDMSLITTIMNSHWGQGIGGYIDRETGEFLSSSDEENESYAEDELRYLPIPQHGSGSGYQDMEDFIETVEDKQLRDLLEIAIDRKGAFGRFKNVLRRSEYELELARWYEFSNQCEYDRGLKWLISEGLTVEDRVNSVLN